MRRISTSWRAAALTLVAVLASTASATPASAETLDGATIIETTVVDAQTGEPLAGVCVFAATHHQFLFPGGCLGEQTSDADGAATVTVASGGHYQLFAWPTHAEGYGAQWVGPRGGTGSQLRAAHIKVPDGGTASAPVVRMDPAGTITGTVTDPSGVPVAAGRVAVGQEGLNVGGSLGFTLIEDGHYSFDVLGPYEWPLQFVAWGVPLQWSGHAVNRHVADTIPVTAGGTTEYNTQLTVGTMVTISQEALPDALIAIALNRQTGDRVGAWLLDPRGGVFTIPVLGPQPVTFRLMFGPDAGFVGGDDFRSATTFVIWPDGQQEITLG